MPKASNLGYPRIGANRELKKATEAYWRKIISASELEREAKELRHKHWKLQLDAGIDIIPSNDFSFYDQVLDMICMLGCVPKRYEWSGGDVNLDTYFAMARGSDEVVAMEMTKWFDTNYHYIVPEFEKDMNFAFSSTKIVDEYLEAKNHGIETRPVLIGPVTFMQLGKIKDEGLERQDIMEAMLPVYVNILKDLRNAGAKSIQIDEPALVLDLCDGAKDAFIKSYKYISNEISDIDIMIATYFDGLRDNTELALSLPVDTIHIDLVRARGQFEEILEKIPDSMSLSLGVVDGRNIWANDISDSLSLIEKAKEKLGGERVIVAPSCSLLHCPADLNIEDELDKEIKSWMAFAKQKLDEIFVIAKGARAGRESIEQEIIISNKIVDSRKTSILIHNKGVRNRISSLTKEMFNRKSDFSGRQAIQHEILNLPLYPTTSIGSFPQTKEIRETRSSYKKKNISYKEYEMKMKKEIEKVVRFQEDIGMDVLVHGEPERNDMVEYFGEQLSGFTFTKNGWVQSYGSRCVKPPIIYGDVERPKAMTVKWAEYAQSLTNKVMKGMLTGPITILQWSFVRNDQPRADTAAQIALAIRDEVSDLEKAGIKIIQIDEAAIREGLPIRKDDWGEYLKWAVDCFKLASCVVEDKTQIHTHMCYSEFNDIIDSIAAMDADVISIETSRSQMELLDAFVEFKYPNEIGPGVYDIHSPRVPTVEEIENLLQKATKVLNVQQIWVNPDCGLKTRSWEEVEPALRNMIEAAKNMRKKI